MKFRQGPYACNARFIRLQEQEAMSRAGCAAKEAVSASFPAVSSDAITTPTDDVPMKNAGEQALSQMAL
jgi:hypothetical protein